MAWSPPRAPASRAGWTGSPTRPSTAATRALPGRKTVSVNGDDPGSRKDRHQHRRAGARSRPARARSRPLLHQQLDDGGRLPARASADRRRQLRRTRVCPGLSPVRRPRDGGRNVRPADCPRRRDVSEAVREILEAEGIEIRLNAKCLAVEKDGDGIVMRLDCSAGRAERARQPSPAGGRPQAQFRRPRP